MPTDKKTKKYDAEDITMMCIRFCEAKGGLLNREMDLSTIECIRYNFNSAMEKLRSLVQRYGNKKDQKKLSEVEAEINN